MSRRGYILATTACAALIAAIIAAANAGRLPVLSAAVQTTAGVDKAIHCLLMGALAFFLNGAVGGRRLRIGRLSVFAGSAAVALFVTVEELSQLALAHRSFSWLDLGADYAGILIAGRLGRQSAAFELVDASGKARPSR